jgi:hypothetical protein
LLFRYFGISAHEAEHVLPAVEVANLVAQIELDIERESKKGE